MQKDDLLPGLPAWEHHAGDLAGSDRQVLEREQTESSRPPEPAGPPAIEAEIMELYDTHASSLHRYSMALTRNSGQSQEAVQECFLRIFVHRMSGHPLADPRRWLFRCLRQVLAESGRNEKNAGLEPLADRQASDGDPEVIFTRQELARIIPELLSPRELECIQLRAEGFQYEEIAHIMGVSSGTVGAMIARAVRKLRENLNRGISGEG